MEEAAFELRSGLHIYFCAVCCISFLRTFEPRAQGPLLPVWAKLG